jgi:Ca-activated chloride channel family protein
MDIDASKDYYNILGVSPFATLDEIKHAYRNLARRYHPDSREADTSTRLFHQIHEAYAVLGNPDTRRSYDRQRDEKRTDGTAPLAFDVLQSQETLYTGHEEQMLYALLDIRPGIASTSERLPLDLSIVIDKSTSMEGPRLASVKAAAREILDQLNDDDFLTIVSFNDRAELLISDQVGSGRTSAKRAINGLRAEGGTELLKGLRTGLRELGSYRGRDVVSHLILLTDGRTYGDDDACVAAAAEAADKDIGITAMGIGEDWNDDLLEEMAALSGGTSAYVSSPAQVRGLLHGMIRKLSSVFATEMILSVRTAPDVSIESVFQTSPSLERLQLSEGVTRLGPLEVDAPRRVLIEAAVGTRQPGDHRLLQADLYGDVPKLDKRSERVRRAVWCRFTEKEVGAEEKDVPEALVRAVNRTTLYRMQEQAWAALQDGDVGQATRRLEVVGTQLLDMGKERLGQAALLEAKNIAERGDATERGRKEIKYGTRRLGFGSEAYD